MSDKLKQASSAERTAGSLQQEVVLLRETLKDLFLASSILRTRIHTHGKAVMNFEDYKRHTTAMLKTENVLRQMQHNDQAHAPATPKP